MADDHDDHQARIARPDAMIERTTSLPSIPARTVTALGPGGHRGHIVRLLTLVCILVPAAQAVERRHCTANLPFRMSVEDSGPPSE